MKKRNGTKNVSVNRRMILLLSLLYKKNYGNKTTINA